MNTEKKERREGVRTSFTTGERKRVKAASREKNMRMRQYIREKALAGDGIPILGNHQVIVEKCALCAWNGEIQELINKIDDNELKKDFSLKMEEWQCQILKYSERPTMI